MKKRIWGYGLWLALAGCLYFFENNTGTRIVLVCSLLLPLLPVLRRMFFPPDTDAVPASGPVSVQSFLFQEEEESNGVRDYVPGDPVNRIHWKLSAKRDDLLVREQAAEAMPSGRPEELPGESAAAKEKRTRNRRLWLPAGMVLLFLLLLLWIPEAARGTQALMNRLFEASERVNAYSYVRFPVGAEQSITMAALFLAAICAALLSLAVLSGSRIPAFLLMTGLVVFQVYFGLSFPVWVNVILLMLFGWRMRPRPFSKRDAGTVLTVIAAVTLAVFLVVPGIDGPTESASESVRDWLGWAVQRLTDVVPETAAGRTETRHVHTRSLAPGNGESLPGEEYRLVTVEEAQISMPRWINYLRIVLLFLLAVALVVIPFLPFLALNARRKKAAEIRKAFLSENVSEAVCAVFRHVIAWLEATENGAGNIPYVCWSDRLPERLPADYRQRFRQCAELFEEAFYSNHLMTENQRRQVLALLDETEKRLLSDSDWKQKLRLKYGKCLYA